MPKQVKRRVKAHFKHGKAPLPRGLEFLSDVDFYAVVEDHTGSRIKRTVELTPRVTKGLLSAGRAYDELSEAGNSLVQKNRELELALKEARSTIVALERTNQQLFDLVEKHDEPRSKPRSEPSHLGRAIEQGFQPSGLPIQGGLPSLGKKK